MSPCMHVTRGPRGGADISTDLMLPSLLFILTLLAPVWASASCAPVETRLRAWIDFPKDETRIGMKTAIIVIPHAYTIDLTTEIVLSPNIDWFDRFHASTMSE
jgi:hypothetical protein